MYIIYHSIVIVYIYIDLSDSTIVILFWIVWPFNL